MATMTRSIELGRDAGLLRSPPGRHPSPGRSARTSAPARVRVTMPVRCWIHSSDESIGPTRSSFGTTRSPRAAPKPIDAGVLRRPCDCLRVWSCSASVCPFSVCSMSSMAAGEVVRASSRRLPARPCMPRLARPTSAPAGASSMMPVTPAAASDSMQLSQRTGRGDLADEQVDERARRRSRRCRRGWSRAVTRGVMARRAPAATARERSTAGAMYRVWNAPATCSGMTRGAGGRVRLQLLERVEGAGDDDLAAAVEVGGLEARARRVARAARPRRRRRTALMPGRARAPRHPPSRRPRSRTKCIASVSASTPAAAAAVISPTEWPATPPIRSRAAVGEEARRA